MKNKTPLSHFLSKHSSFIPKGIFLSKGSIDFWTLCVRARNDDERTPQTATRETVRPRFTFVVVVAVGR